MNYNRSIVGGYLARDPELKYTPKGTAVVDLGIGVNRSWVDQATNERKEEVTFVNCIAFAGVAETIAKHFRKGKPILVEGRLRVESWDDKQSGQKRSKMVVLVESFSFGGDKATGSESRPAAAAPRRPAIPPAELPPGTEDDDVPF